MGFDFNRKVDVDCKGHVLNLGNRTYIMGILNVTPDSFSDGGQYTDAEKAVGHAREMSACGADIIDVGGESTRPGHVEVSAEEEVRRVLPVVERLVKQMDIPISVDTSKAEVADQVLNAGAHMINDIWGLQKDEDLAGVVARHGAAIVIMHNQNGTIYENDIMETIVHFLKKSVRIALDAGIKKEKIIIDPGIGFGKTLEQNIQVMLRLDELNTMGYPILLGTSRKSMIRRTLDLPVSGLVEGTVATSVIGIMKGVDVLRVHDVEENLKVAKMTDRIVRGDL